MLFELYNLTHTHTLLWTKDYFNQYINDSIKDFNIFVFDIPYWILVIIR